VWSREGDGGGYKYRVNFIIMMSRSTAAPEMNTPHIHISQQQQPYNNNNNNTPQSEIRELYVEMWIK